MAPSARLQNVVGISLCKSDRIFRYGMNNWKEVYFTKFTNNIWNVTPASSSSIGNPTWTDFSSEKICTFSTPTVEFVFSAFGSSLKISTFFHSLIFLPIYFWSKVSSSKIYHLSHCYEFHHETPIPIIIILSVTRVVAWRTWNLSTWSTATWQLGMFSSLRMDRPRSVGSVGCDGFNPI